MRWRTKVRDVPARVTAGAFILNSGLIKRSADGDAAAQLHGFARGTYPFLKKVDAPRFARWLATGEIALGAALLVPAVPTLVAGAGLAAFSGGLLGLYLRTPGMRQDGSVRPTEEGTALAKDVWMLGMGLSLVLDALTTKPSRSRES